MSLFSIKETPQTIDNYIFFLFDRKENSIFIMIYNQIFFYFKFADFDANCEN